MEFRLLGTIEAWDRGEQLAVGGGKQRALLALLLINAGRAVPVDQVLDELWRGRPPPTAKNALWVYVANLRGTLEPGRARGARGELLVTGPSSYALYIDGEAIDSTRFERLSSAGQQALRSDPAAALGVLRDALQLWRGPALAELGMFEFAQSEQMRLDELKAAAIEARLEAELMLGRHAEVVGELKALAGRHPLRERLHGLLMTALYRSDRQAEALAAYESARTILVAELGVDPGVPLQRLHQAILRHEPGLDSWSHVTDPGQPAAGPAVNAAARPTDEGPGQRTLPSPPNALIGRDREVAEPMTFAALLRKLRTEARLTQEELAEAAGLSSRSVSDLERGHQPDRS